MEAKKTLLTYTGLKKLEDELENLKVVKRKEVAGKIKEGKKSSQRYKDIVEVTGGRLVPEWLESDIENLKGTVKELPTREAIDVPVDEMMIVELYSK